MPATSKIVAAVAAIAAALLGAVGVGALGVFPMDRDVHPPCEELPDVDESAARLADAPAFAEEIKALGDGITVEVGRPCPDDPNRGLITVAYGARSERDDIRALLGQRDGFGVPVHLERR